jgi:hypothetical protein
MFELCIFLTNQSINEGAFTLDHSIHYTLPYLIFLFDSVRLIGKPWEIGVDAQLEERRYFGLEVAFFGLQTEAVVFELYAGLGLPDATEAFEVGFETLEELFVGLFGLEVIGVEVLKMGNWWFIAVVIDPRPPVNVLFCLLHHS